MPNTLPVPVFVSPDAAALLHPGSAAIDRLAGSKRASLTDAEIDAELSACNAGRRP